jgi:uncharacterized protein YlxW (UPF0749 family)
MQSFLSIGIATGRKGYEQFVNDAKCSRDEKIRLEEENRKLREENERLKNHSKKLTSQVQNLTEQCSKQKTALDALKQELEKAPSFATLSFRTTPMWCKYKVVMI